MTERLCQTQFVDGGFWRPNWQCPFCEHSLSYRTEHKGVARLAMVSHLVRCHEFSYWQVCGTAPEARQEAEEYFDGHIW